MRSIIYVLDRYPLRLLFLHLALGFIASQNTQFSTLWGWLVVIIGSYYTLKCKNHFNTAGLFAAYLVGLEIVLRMTDAVVLW